MFQFIRTYHAVPFGLTTTMVLNLMLPVIMLVCAPQLAEYPTGDQHQTVEAPANRDMIPSPGAVHGSAASERSFPSCWTDTDNRWECCEYASLRFDRTMLRNSSGELTASLLLKLTALPVFNTETSSHTDTRQWSPRPVQLPYPQSPARVHLLVSSFLL